MLPDLTDQFIADAFTGILHTSKIPTTGANLPPVYDGLGNKTSFSVGSDGNGASFTGTLSSDNYSIGNYATLIDYLYPIGSVYFSTSNINPSTRFAGTNWTQISQGRFIVGVGFGDDGTESKEFFEGNNGGEYNHKLTIGEMPSHTHGVINFNPKWRSQDVDLDGGQRYYFNPTTQTAPTGNDLPHNNIPPGFGLYVWERIPL